MRMMMKEKRRKGAKRKSREQNEFSLEDYIEDDEIPTYKLNSSNYSKDDKYEEIPFSVGSSFQEHLESQLGLRTLTEREEMLADLSYRKYR